MQNIINLLSHFSARNLCYCLLTNSPYIFLYSVVLFPGETLRTAFAFFREEQSPLSYLRMQVIIKIGPDVYNKTAAGSALTAGKCGATKGLFSEIVLACRLFFHAKPVPIKMCLNGYCYALSSDFNLNVQQINKVVVNRRKRRRKSSLDIIIFLFARKLLCTKCDREMKKGLPNRFDFIER